MAKTVIKPISPNDVIEVKGTDKIDVKRGVKINDVQQELVVQRSLNNKKGTFDIVFKWNMNAVTGDDTLDTATLQTVLQMFMFQRDKSLQWRDDWKQGNQNPKDPDQLAMQV